MEDIILNLLKEEDHLYFRSISRKLISFPKQQTKFPILAVSYWFCQFLLVYNKQIKKICYQGRGLWERQMGSIHCFFLRFSSTALFFFSRCNFTVNNTSEKSKC